MNKINTIAENYEGATDAILLQFLRSSFFLPPDIMELAESEGWMIPKIQVVEGHDYRASVAHLETLNAEFHYHPSTDLCVRANWLGVSLRRNEKTKQLLVCVKAWHKKENGNGSR